MIFAVGVVDVVVYAVGVVNNIHDGSAWANKDQVEEEEAVDHNQGDQEEVEDTPNDNHNMVVAVVVRQMQEGQHEKWWHRRADCWIRNVLLHMDTALAVAVAEAHAQRAPSHEVDGNAVHDNTVDNALHTDGAVVRHAVDSDEEDMEDTPVVDEDDHVPHLLMEKLLYSSPRAYPYHPTRIPPTIFHLHP